MYLRMHTVLEISLNMLIKIFANLPNKINKASFSCVEILSIF